MQSIKVALHFLLLFCPLPKVAFSAPEKGDCDSPKAETDLRHCSFAGKNLGNIDLHGTLLDGVDFSNVREIPDHLAAMLEKESIQH